MKGLLLVNLGSPEEPTLRAVRNYLKEFLMDPYVLQVPTLLRAAIVHGLILPFRPKKTLQSYLKIWTKEGSPLIIGSYELKEKLQSYLHSKKENTHVEIAMRYGDPSLVNALNSFRSKNINEIKVIPLYPQFAMSSSLTVENKLKSLNKEKFNHFFELNFIKSFYNDSRFTHSLIEVTKNYLKKNIENYDHLLISFHGLPKSHLGQKIGSEICNFNDCCNSITNKNKNCYRAQCFETARILASGLGLSNDKWSIGFQSRLTQGWIEPFTDVTVENLAKKGIKNLAVVCPSFISDCLETLEEINLREKNRFINAGGENFYYIPCVNDSDTWVKSLGEF